MAVPLLGGRAFTDADLKTAPKVVIVNEAFARRFWPGENPVGKHIAVGRQTPSEVVGIAKDVLNSGLAVESAPQLYLPFAQLPWADANLLVRTTLPTESVILEIRGAISSIDPEQPITNVRTGSELLSSGRNQSQLMMSVVAQFSILAFVLAVVGIYGVLSYTVSQRTRELGIRLALGAEKSHVVGLVIRHGLKITLIGVLAGLIASALLTRLLSSILFHVSSLDAVTFAIAAVVFTAVALFAAYLPARRAAKVNPVEVLH
jgi:putative ABC transport system permease protein